MIEVEEGQERREFWRVMGRGERSARCFLVWKELGAGKGKDFVPNVRVKGGGGGSEYTLQILQRMSSGQPG